MIQTRDMPLNGHVPRLSATIFWTPGISCPPETSKSYQRILPKLQKHLPQIKGNGAMTWYASHPPAFPNTSTHQSASKECDSQRVPWTRTFVEQRRKIALPLATATTLRIWWHRFDLLFPQQVYQETMPSWSKLPTISPKRCTSNGLSFRSFQLSHVSCPCLIDRNS